MSTEVQKYFERQIGNTKGAIKVAVFGRVEKIDLKYMRLDVKVDMTSEQKEEMPDDEILMQVPISTHQTKEFVIRPPYAVGDDVLLVVSHQDIEPILFDGGDHSRRTHSIDDALVIGGVTRFTQPLPGVFDEYIEDFVIAKRDFTSRVILKKSGDVLIETDESMNLSAKKNLSLHSETNISISAPNGTITHTDSRGSF